MPVTFWDAIRDLNGIRYKLAHNLEPEGLDKELRKFFGRFHEIEDCRTMLRDEQSIPDRLVSCFCFLGGALVNLRKPADEDTDEGSV